MGELQLTLRSYGRQTVTRLPLLLWSLWTVLLVEVLSRGQWGETFGWTFSAIPELVLNGFVVLGLIMLLTALTASVRLSFWLVSTCCLAFGLVSGVKLEILGVPFLPWDLLLTSETKDMTPYISGLLNFQVISAFVVFIVISLLLIYKLPKVTLRLNWKHRLTMALASLLLLVSIYNDGAVSLKKLANVENMAWDQTENVRTNGFLLTTMMNLKFLSLKEPEGYSEQTIRGITGSVPKEVAAESAVKPNIIVVLSESFWDPTQMKNVTFSQDPIPFYRSLAEKYTSGTMLSPQYGGGTANVEFEVLTGNSMRFLPQGSIPYNQYVDRGIDSIASILARQGYATTAINPFHSWFYNSKTVYENFGFSKYVSQEFFEPDYAGPYLSDRSVAKHIIKEQEKSDGPDFIFANTMENHYHYYPGKFKENTIQVSGVEGETKGLLETFAQGLLGADAMLKELVTHYEAKGEPTMIVFFGDHLPSLGENYQAYKDAGYLKEQDPEFLNKMYRVPVLVWDNYLPRKREHLSMSPSFLSSYVLKQAERPGTYYTDFLYQLSQRTPIIPPTNLYESMNIQTEALKAYELLQYDIIFGKQYGYGDIKQSIKNPNYVIGTGPMRIDSVAVEHAADGSMLSVRGVELPPGAIVHVNGQPVETKRNDDSGELEAKLVEPVKSETDTVQVEVVVKDSRDKIVVKTTPYALAAAELGTKLAERQ
ncbi:LTA synthase family protein [Paenibacillus sp. YYML68]|uniref:LTA synthase family protein n=1 Tax=Paenibacillus sp. YYML68 TaxID=2909250 RepID=UPI00248F7090|nr:sulfatase-like hydrolase/transferase [Paenibacillus sp. YYML68]